MENAASITSAQYLGLNDAQTIPGFSIGRLAFVVLLGVEAGRRGAPGLGPGGADEVENFFSAAQFVEIAENGLHFDRITLWKAGRIVCHGNSEIKS